MQHLCLSVIASLRAHLRSCAHQMKRANKLSLNISFFSLSKPYTSNHVTVELELSKINFSILKLKFLKSEI